MRCPCSCNSGGQCGGCGHAGCGGRRARRIPALREVPTVAPRTVLPDDMDEQTYRIVGVRTELDKLRADRVGVAAALDNLRISRGADEARVAAAVIGRCRDVVARLVPPSVEVPGTDGYPCYYCGTLTPAAKANCSPWLVATFGWVVACQECGGDDEGGAR